jgi:hypothetical protein
MQSRKKVRIKKKAYFKDNFFKKTNAIMLESQGRVDWYIIVEPPVSWIISKPRN